MLRLERLVGLVGLFAWLWVLCVGGLLRLLLVVSGCYVVLLLAGCSSSLLGVASLFLYGLIVLFLFATLLL